jgi:hypothetical protein
MEIQEAHPITRVAPFQNMTWILGYEDFIPSSSSKDLSMLTGCRKVPSAHPNFNMHST